MRNYFLLFILLFLFGCNADSENDASKRNADWVWWVDEHSGKGEWIKSGDHTTVKDGKYTTFYYNGNVYSKGHKKNGLDIDTIFFYDTSGVPFGFNSNINGFDRYYYYKNGPYRIYFNTGELSGEGIIANNRREKWTGYLKDGQISFQHDYTNGVGWCTENYDNGKPKRVYYITGYDDSVLSTKMWNENGVLVFDAEIENGEYIGKIKKYFDDGKIKSECDYKAGKAFGDYVEYFENGLKSSLRQYNNDLPDGDAIDYYPDGKIKNQTSFKNGKANGNYWKFYESGKIKLRCSYNLGNLNGVLENYDSTSKLISREIYQNGVRLN